MKLNNHGWGDKEFIISIVAMLVVLLVVVINVHRLYDALDTPYSTNDNTPVEKEEKKQETNTESKEQTSEPVEVVYNEDYYKKYQNKMIDATRNYVIYASPSIPSEGLRVDLSTLVSKNYIESLNDMLDGSVCEGYSFVKLNNDSSLNIKTYLNCSNYVTEGY